MRLLSSISQANGLPKVGCAAGERWRQSPSGAWRRCALPRVSQLPFIISEREGWLNSREPASAQHAAACPPAPGRPVRCSPASCACSGCLRPFSGMGRSYASDEDLDQFGDPSGLRRSCWTPGEPHQHRPCGVGLGREARLGRRQQPATPCRGGGGRPARRSRAPAPGHPAGRRRGAAAAAQQRHIDLTHPRATRWGWGSRAPPRRLPAGPAQPGVPDGGGARPRPRAHASMAPPRPSNPKLLAPGARRPPPAGAARPIEA